MKRFPPVSFPRPWRPEPAGCRGPFVRASGLRWSEGDGHAPAHGPDDRPPELPVNRIVKWKSRGRRCRWPSTGRQSDRGGPGVCPQGGDRSGRLRTRYGQNAGEFLLARKTEPGRPAAEVLAEIMPRIVLAVPFRKVMRWGTHDLEYPRPLQWLVALLGTDLVSLKVDYLAAGGLSRGHRTLAEDRPRGDPGGRFLSGGPASSAGDCRPPGDARKRSAPVWPGS